MGIKYLWDTNTAIYFLQQQFPPPAEKFIDETLKDSGAANNPLVHHHGILGLQIYLIMVQFNLL